MIKDMIESIIFEFSKENIALDEMRKFRITRG